MIGPTASSGHSGSSVRAASIASFAFAGSLWSSSVSLMPARLTSDAAVLTITSATSGSLALRLVHALTSSAA